jgi:hypothetical protein
LPIRFNFEFDPVGQPPHGLELHVDNKGDSIQVTDKTAASGKHSLKIKDAPGLSANWKPHLCERMQIAAGRVQNRFSLRLEANADVTFEWRDWSVAKYETGPQFFIRDGKLLLGGREPIDLPTDQWLHFEVTAAIGNSQSQKWSLKVTLPGQPPREFRELAFASPKFDSLTWMGFTSNADAATVFYLDDFEVVVK